YGNAYSNMASGAWSACRMVTRNREANRHLIASISGSINIETATASGRFIDYLLSANGSYHSITLYNAEGRMIVHSGGYGLPDFRIEQSLDPSIKKIMGSNLSAQIWAPAEIPGADSSSVDIYMNILDELSLQSIGVMQICAMTSLVSDRGLSDSDRYRSFFLTGEGDIIWFSANHFDDEYVRGLIDTDGRQDFYSADGSYYVRRQEFPLGAGTLYTTIQVRDFNRNNMFMLIQMELLLVIIGMIVLFLFLLLSRRMFSPLIYLSRTMDQINPKFNVYEFDREAIDKLAMRKDEVGRLCSSFDMLITRIGQSIENIESANQEKRRLELELLMSQIKPHFLYNTIETICGMASLGRMEDVYTTAKMLGIFYRCNLSEGSHLVSVETELMHVESYIKIMQVRSGGPIRYRITAPPDLRTQTVLSMILQPVVENALIHGLRTEEGGLVTVDVSSSQDGQSIIFVVEDNGAGMPQETLEMIRLGQKAGGTFRSFGLHNVNSRIKLYCGQQYGMYCESEPGKGTRVTITASRMYGGEAQPQSILK
ncbi:MAG: histidine kinase, partial [Oscillospiraceae bacterium]|nr:histidine kinase [Oscillospiraceae bacterium]